MNIELKILNLACIIIFCLSIGACGGNKATTLTTVPPVFSTTGAPAGYVLVWSDEFNTGAMPDQSKWTYDTEANAIGWYNNELQYYAVGRPENSRLSDGKLIITAQKETINPAPPDYRRPTPQVYTSARLHTRDKASWTYGFYEVRAKMPCGVGTWPAIWMLGMIGEHPANGEIDIMEQVGKNPKVIEGTIYTASTGAALGGSSGSTLVEDACTEFHNYQLTWTKDSLEIGVDNKPYFSYSNPRTSISAWPFDKPQYLLINLAIGGDMAGPVDDSIFSRGTPVQMEIDYVRVYQKP